MIKKKVQEEINDQIRAELQSAYTYLAFSGWFESQNLSGFAHWMKKQWEEEVQHAMKFYQHLIARDGQVELKAIDQPTVTLAAPKEAFEQALEQERNITKRIHKLYDLAKSEGDYPLESLLLWFIDEQVEEEEQVRQILDQLNLIEGDGMGTLMLDRELSERA